MSTASVITIDDIERRRREIEALSDADLQARVLEDRAQYVFGTLAEAEFERRNSPRPRIETLRRDLQEFESWVREARDRIAADENDKLARADLTNAMLLVANQLTEIAKEEVRLGMHALQQAAE